MTDEWQKSKFVTATPSHAVQEEVSTHNEGAEVRRDDECTAYREDIAAAVPLKGNAVGIAALRA
jgi:hypothetical protein